MYLINVFEGFKKKACISKVKQKISTVKVMQMIIVTASALFDNSVFYSGLCFIVYIWALLLL